MHFHFIERYCMEEKKQTRRPNIYLNTHIFFLQICSHNNTTRSRTPASVAKLRRVLHARAASPVKYFRVFLVPGQVVSSAAAQKKKCLNSITFWLTSVCGGVGATTTTAQFLPRTPCNILNPFNESYDFILLSLLLLMHAPPPCNASDPRTAQWNETTLYIIVIIFFKRICKTI